MGSYLGKVYEKGDENRVGNIGISHDADAWSQYNVLETYESEMLYYRVASNGIVNEVVSSLFRGKDMPAFDQHRLVEMYQKGTSIAQTLNNK